MNTQVHKEWWFLVVELHTLQVNFFYFYLFFDKFILLFKDLLTHGENQNIFLAHEMLGIQLKTSLLESSMF